MRLTIVARAFSIFCTHSSRLVPSAVTRSVKVPEVAERLFFSVPTVYRKLERGEIPGGVRIGRSWRVDPAVFEPWLDEQAAG